MCGSSWPVPRCISLIGRMVTRTFCSTGLEGVRASKLSSSRSHSGSGKYPSELKRARRGAAAVDASGSNGWRFRGLSCSGASQPGDRRPRAARTSGPDRDPTFGRTSPVQAELALSLVHEPRQQTQDEGRSGRSRRERTCGNMGAERVLGARGALVRGGRPPWRTHQHRGLQAPGQQEWRDHEGRYVSQSRLRRLQRLGRATAGQPRPSSESGQLTPPSLSLPACPPQRVHRLQQLDLPQLPLLPQAPQNPARQL